MEWSSKGSFLPPASLQLLVPPVRLMSAFVWQVVQQHNVKHYDKLLDFISLVTEIVPELLSPSQKAQLVLGLRATLILDLCRSDGLTNIKAIHSHLDKIHKCSAELSSSDQTEGADTLKSSYSNFARMVQNILSVPFEKEFFFQEVYPEKYGSAYKQRIQQLVSLFLYRLEQLLPIPDLQQTTTWLTDTFASEFGSYLSSPETMKTLLFHHRELKTLSSAPLGNEDDVILSTLASCTHAGWDLYSEGDDEDEYVSDEGSLVLQDLEGDSQSSDEGSVDWQPKKKRGLGSSLSTCSQCSFTHRLRKKVQEHMQREHHTTAPTQKRKSPTKKTRTKSQDSKAAKKKQGDTKKPRRPKLNDGKKVQEKPKDEDAENKKRRRQKQPGEEDKRFLSTRPINKDFPEEEIRCSTCEKVFEHPNQLKTHMKIHSYRYWCGECDKGFTSQSGFYQHERLHKKGREFICKECNKGFLCSYSLKQHERLHDGPTNLCNICGKNFSKNGYIRHMQMHRGERNYLCTACGKSFLSSGELLLHNRSHTGELPYTCKLCGKGFSCKSHLTVHTRSHTGERPYICSECGKRFLTLNCLKRHTLSHNGVKPFKCADCGKEFSQQGNLKRHMTTHKTAT